MKTRLGYPIRRELLHLLLLEGHSRVEANMSRKITLPFLAGNYWPRHFAVNEQEELNQLLNLLYVHDGSNASIVSVRWLDLVQQLPCELRTTAWSWTIHYFQERSIRTDAALGKEYAPVTEEYQL
ncbi:hypothetical protein AgCh_032288 [Apium graveolens]